MSENNWNMKEFYQKYNARISNNMMVIIINEQSERKNKTKISWKMFSFLLKGCIYFLDQVSIIGSRCIFFIYKRKKISLGNPQCNILFINV